MSRPLASTLLAFSAGLLLLGYPAILVTTSYNDSQVMYREPAKCVARLQTLKTDSNPLVFKTKMQPADRAPTPG